MFQAASRLPRRTLLSASVAASGLALHTSPEREKRQPSPLEQQIRLARRKVRDTYHEAHAQVQGVVSRWIGVEHAIENRVKSIISPNEPLTPGLLYVGVATLTGSILARNRMLPTRLILPPIFLFVSAKKFLPQTTANLTSYLGSLEERYAPTLAEKHQIANAHTRMTWERVKEKSQSGRQWVNKEAEVAVDKVQEVTGLKLKETLGWNLKQPAMERIEARTSEIAKAVEERAEETKAAVKKTAEEVKDQTATKMEEIKRLV
ncbi:apolipo protein O-domain-containing protein [Lyophyllum atratum]|nr:apolipo protein O-domain-containing protein [Lyophyllum atratum]